MKKILITVVILIGGVCLLLFIEGKILLSKFGPVNTNRIGGKTLNELLYSLKYNNCLLQSRHWSTTEGICVIEYQDRGKSCFIGKDCLSGICLLDETAFRQWTDQIYRQNGGLDPNKSTGSGDKITYPQLPDNVKGQCSSTNLCDYNGAVIQVDNGVRHAIGSHCFEI